MKRICDSVTRLSSLTRLRALCLGMAFLFVLGTGIVRAEDEAYVSVLFGNHEGKIETRVMPFDAYPGLEAQLLGNWESAAKEAKSFVKAGATVTSHPPRPLICIIGVFKSEKEARKQSSEREKKAKAFLLDDFKRFLKQARASKKELAPLKEEARKREEERRKKEEEEARKAIATSEIADWCTLVHPKQTAVGLAMEVKVKLKAVDAGLKVGADLHWKKADGKHGGYLTWGGAPQEAKEGGEYTFKFKIKAKEEMAAVSILVYLSPTGNWKEQVKSASSPLIPVKAAAKEDDAEKPADKEAKL